MIEVGQYLDRVSLSRSPSLSFAEPGQRGGEDGVLHVHVLHHQPGGRQDRDIDGHRGEQQRGDQPPLHRGHPPAARRRQQSGQ